MDPNGAKKDNAAARARGLLQAAVKIASAYAASGQIKSGDMPALIQQVHNALKGAIDTGAPASVLKPAVAPNRSIHHDYIICLEDGRRLKMLKRYLRAAYGMSPDDYRRKWGLPPDYPMVAPAYAQRRSEFAKRIGLGKAVRKNSVE